MRKNDILYFVWWLIIVVAFVLVAKGMWGGVR